MKYVLLLMLLISVSVAQVKEQRYQIVVIPTEMLSITTPQMPVIPDLGNLKSIPMMIDTQTGKTWILQKTMSEDQTKIEWTWYEIKMSLPLKNLSAK